MSSSKKYLFLDIETTGLSTYAGLIEVYAQLTDYEFREIYTPLHIVCKVPLVSEFASWTPKWDEQATAMHQKNGLIAEMQASISALDRKGVEDAMDAWFGQLPGKPEDRYLSGSSVHTDRYFLARTGFPIDKYISHRHFDLSSFKTLDITVGADLMPGKTNEGGWAGSEHRGKTDVLIDMSVARKLQKMWKVLKLQKELFGLMQ